MHRDEDGIRSKCVVGVERESATSRSIRQISEKSDFQSLSRLLKNGELDPAHLDTFAAALVHGNPAVVEKVLRAGREQGGEHFLTVFRSWGQAPLHPDRRHQRIRSRSPPLHLCSHSGSPEVLSVLLKFMVETSSCEAMVNAKDMNGRTALQLASWSPRPRCPGRRLSIIRSVACPLRCLLCTKSSTVGGRTGPLIGCVCSHVHAKGGVAGHAQCPSCPRYVSSCHLTLSVSSGVVLAVHKS